MRKNLLGEETESLGDTLIRLGIPDFIPLGLLMQKRGVLATFLEAAYAVLEKYNYDEALLLLHEMSKDHVGSGFLYLADFNGDPYGRSQVRSLIATMERCQVSHPKGTPYQEARTRTIQNLGTESHAALRHIAHQQFEPNLQPPSSINQLKLFGKEEQYALDFGEPPYQFLSNKYPYAISSNGRVSAAHLKILYSHWQWMAKAIRDNESWHVQFLTLLSGVHELRLLLYPILGNRVLPQRLRRRSDAALEYLEILTLMTWTVAILWAAKEPMRPIFGEIPPIHRRHGFSGGRIDRITAFPTNRFSNDVLERLFKATKDVQPASVGQAHRLVRSITRAGFYFKIGDYKCSVGDSKNGDSVLRSQDVLKPLAKHVGKMKDYVAQSHLDIQLTYGLSDVWNDSPDGLGEADLIYLFPDQEEPRIFSITLDLAERREAFRNIACKLDTARVSAEFREKIAITANSLKRRLEKKSPPRKSVSKISTPLFYSQPDLPQFPQELVEHP